MKKILLIVAAVLAFTACGIFTPKPDLDAVTNVVVTELGESLQITWDEVAGATSYTLYFTNDGSTPSVTSTSITASTNTYLHEELNETLTYKYLVKASASDFNASLSTATEGNLPLPIFTLTGDFSSQAGKQILVKFFYLTFSSTEDTTVSNATEIVTRTLTPDADGTITATTTFERTEYLGFIIIIDNDEDGTLSTGDIVSGTGDINEHSYSGYTVFLSKSTEETKDWSEYSSHIF